MRVFTVGYACLNETLKPNVLVNRTLRKSTFHSKGLNYVSDLVLLNIQDLEKVVKWNIENNILLYRLSSDMFPWWTFYNFKDLKDWKEINKILKRIGKMDIRLTFHPGPFNKLASTDSTIVNNTLAELEKHAEIMDIMGLDKSYYNKINIHVGGAYNSKSDTLIKFNNNLNLLSNSVTKRLTVENDDKAALYSVQDLTSVQTPIVFDYHHHKFCDGNLTEKEALLLALKSWPTDIVPIVHYSESAVGKRPQAHSDYIANKIKTYGQKIDIMIEAKQKDKTVLQLIKDNLIVK